MIELFKEAFPENFSEKKVDWVRKSGQNARMSQVPSPDLKQLYCGNNQLTMLPNLHISLNSVSCYQNKLTLYSHN